MSPSLILMPFAKAGFTACGSHGYLSPPLRQEATALEIFS